MMRVSLYFSIDIFSCCPAARMKQQDAKFEFMHEYFRGEYRWTHNW